MRVSAGLAVIGLSGKTRIQTLPPRFIKRVSAIRAASIWRDSNQHGSRACKPYSPKAIVAPRWALPLMRPRCCLRNFERDGASNMALSSIRSELPRYPSPAAWQAGPPAQMASSDQLALAQRLEPRAAAGEDAALV